MGLDEARIKRELIDQWGRGGMDTLVKVMPFNLMPDRSRPIGYCTSFKFIVGRTPLEMERIVGLREDSKLAQGAAIYAVRPLPNSAQFAFRGHSNTPEGISTTFKAAHPDYPPGLGAPQWELAGLTQANLLLLDKVLPGQSFRYMVSQLGPVV